MKRERESKINIINSGIDIMCLLWSANKEKKKVPGGLCDSHSGRAERHRTVKKEKTYFYS